MKNIPILSNAGLVSSKNHLVDLPITPIKKENVLANVVNNFHSTNLYVSNIDTVSWELFNQNKFKDLHS